MAASCAAFADSSGHLPRPMDTRLPWHCKSTLQAFVPPLPSTSDRVQPVCSFSVNVICKGGFGGGFGGNPLLVRSASRAFHERSSSPSA